jgi:hypothetical protein
MTVLTAGWCRQEVGRIRCETSVEVGEGDGLAARPTDAAVEGVLDDDGVDDLVGAGAIEADDVRPELGVFATGAPPAEAAGAESGLLTGPAIHAAHL